jgi:GNAT superfamily N-acetyltransferase
MMPEGSQAPRVPLVVRDARADERETIRALTMRAYSEYAMLMTAEGWAGLYESLRLALDTQLPAHRLVAELDGRIVGGVMLFPPAVDAYAGMAGAAAHPELRLLAVSPSARGFGVGEALVAACVRRALEDGARAITLHTSASMHSAIRLYERLGFTREPELDFQPPGTERVEGYRLMLPGLGGREPAREARIAP